MAQSADSTIPRRGNMLSLPSCRTIVAGSFRASKGSTGEAFFCAHGTADYAFGSNPPYAPRYFKIKDWVDENYAASKASILKMNLLIEADKAWVSKPSAAESKYLEVIRARMAEGSILCVCTGQRATDPHHPLGSFWESGKGLKAHDWFVIPSSAEVHLEYHRGPKTWAAKYGSHQELLLTFWKSIGFERGDFMTVGMGPKRAASLDRVLHRLK
jgi:Protein of unknown function (DUF968)